MIVWQTRGNVFIETEWELFTLNSAFKAERLRLGALDSKQRDGANLNCFRVCDDGTQLDGGAAWRAELRVKISHIQGGSFGPGELTGTAENKTNSSIFPKEWG